MFAGRPKPDPTGAVYVVSFAKRIHDAVYVTMEPVQGHNRFKLVCRQRDVTLPRTTVRFTDEQLDRLQRGDAVQLDTHELRITKSQ